MHNVGECQLDENITNSIGYIIQCDICGQQPKMWPIILVHNGAVSNT